MKLILGIRTDAPEARLILADGRRTFDEYSWTAHRTLAATIHIQIKALLERHQADWPDLAGIVCFKGPGSFTGLRIGLSVANALAAGLKLPTVSEMGDDWFSNGAQRLERGENEAVALPFYGRDPHVTAPRK